MAERVIQSEEKTAVAPASPAVARERASQLVRQVMSSLASLKLTVVLFALAIVLVFSGTLAQVDAGIWTVVDKYFRTAFVWIPFQIFFPRTLSVPGGFPFPGGWLIGGLLLVNLLCAHAVRFKLSWKRSGILLIHAGLIIMLVSELVTGLFAVEARMTIAEGETVGFVDVSSDVELAIIDDSDPETNDVVVVPDGILRQGGLIQDDRLPADVEVREYMTNSELAAAAATPEYAQYAVLGSDGLRYAVEERPEGSGVEADQREDAAAAVVTFKAKDSGRELGTYLLSVWFYPNYTLRQLNFRPQRLEVDGKSYLVELRFRRAHKPYQLHLIDFRHDVYVGTTTAKDFSSYVRLVDPSRNVDREVRIYMNHPLRYAGETFFQSSFLPGDRGTILQVVRNPGWLMPYISCVVVALGMLVHFGLNLFKFLLRRASL